MAIIFGNNDHHQVISQTPCTRLLWFLITWWWPI